LPNQSFQRIGIAIPKVFENSKKTVEKVKLTDQRRNKV